MIFSMSLIERKTYFDVKKRRFSVHSLNNYFAMGLSVVNASRGGQYQRVCPIKYSMI